jgi:hypothetical protein
MVPGTTSAVLTEVGQVRSFATDCYSAVHRTGSCPKEMELNTDQAFYLRVSEALAGCQLVEQQLKLYISLALDLIRRRVGKDLPFKMTGEDFADCSLEGLIKQFNKLSDAPQLVKALNAFKTSGTS